MFYGFPKRESVCPASDRFSRPGSAGLEIPPCRCLADAGEVIFAIFINESITITWWLRGAESVVGGGRWMVGWHATMENHELQVQRGCRESASERVASCFGSFCLLESV